MINESNISEGPSDSIYQISVNKKRKKAAPSLVWNYFDNIKGKYKCKFCPSEYFCQFINFHTEKSL